MRQIDTNEETPALGPPIRPEPAPPAPRRFNSGGTIWQSPDGKLSTNIPPPDSPFFPHSPKGNP